MEDYISQTDPLVLALAGILVPLLVSIVATLRTSPEVKAALGAVTGLGVGAFAGWFSGIDSREGIMTAAVATYAWSQIMYMGVLRPAGADEFVERRLGRTSESPEVLPGPDA